MVSRAVTLYLLTSIDEVENDYSISYISSRRHCFGIATWPVKYLQLDHRRFVAFLTTFVDNVVLYLKGLELTRISSRTHNSTMGNYN